MELLGAVADVKFDMEVFVVERVAALVITYLLTRAANYIAKKRTNPIRAALIAFLVVSAISLLITTFTMGVGKGFALYIPCLVLWLIVDIVTARKTSRGDKTGPALDPNSERKTPD